MEISANVTTFGGAITLRAGGAINQGAGVDVVSNGATIEVLAATGGLTMADDARLMSGGGNIQADAGASVSLGGVHAIAGIVSITSQNADIVDAGDLHVDVISAALRLNAGGSIGELGVGVNPVDVTAPVISAVAGTGINLLAAGDVVIDSACHR